ncbi:MAG: DUF1080 domain-containing protein [Candidatus Sumerlaeota bacterium]|nr:DUF1080 domain-containing protein [Candidatus Sumerlaeota bacterium]
MRHARLFVCMLLILGAAPLFAADASVDPFMGDWQGEQKAADGSTKKIIAQVIPLGADTYKANLLPEFDVRVPPIAVLDGKLADGKISFTGKAGEATIRQDEFSGKIEGAQSFTFAMKKTVRLSPTLGAKPPQGAVVLLGPDTKDLQTDWQRDNGQSCGWKLIGDGAMQCVPGKGSIITKRKFKDGKVHVEFRLPYEPAKRGQDRGNSGVYLQARYEVQVLDSYGLEGKDNECGGIYKVSTPRVNMCAPPLQWQTYDITFRAPEMDGDKVVKSARISVMHNGVKINEDVELKSPTTAAPFNKIASEGGLYLQDHGHPVEYRNIWMEELK